MRIFTLEIDKKTCALAGKELGKKIYKEQLEEQIQVYLEEETPIVISFPANVELVSISFTKGLFELPIKRYGLNKVSTLFHIETNNPKLTEKIIGDIYF